MNNRILFVLCLLLSFNINLGSQNVSGRKQKISLLNIQVFNAIDIYSRGNISISFSAKFKYPWNEVGTAGYEPVGNDDGGYIFYAVIRDRKGKIINDTSATMTPWSIIPQFREQTFASSLHIWFEDISLVGMGKVTVEIKALDLRNNIPESGRLFKKRIEITGLRADELKKRDFTLGGCLIYKDTLYKNIFGMLAIFDCKRLIDTVDLDQDVRKYTFNLVLRDTTGRIVFHSGNQLIFNGENEQSFLPVDSAKNIKVMIPYSYIAINQGHHRLSADISYTIDNGIRRSKPIITSLITYKQPETQRVNFSFSNLTISDGLEWDTRFLGPGNPDPYWILLLNGNIIGFNKSTINSFILPNDDIEFYALEMDTAQFRVYDDDGGIKRFVKPSDDYIGGLDFILSESRQYGKKDGISFGHVTNSTIILKTEKATFLYDGPIVE